MQNFPTVGLIDGNFRQNLEETGMSYEKEVQMVALARRIRGCRTLTLTLTPTPAATPTPIPTLTLTLTPTLTLTLNLTLTLTLTLTRRMGLLTTPYVFDVGEAERMAGAGADVVVAHMVKL